MLKKIAPFLFFVLLTPLHLHSQTLKEVLDRHFTAAGQEALGSHSTEISSGTMVQGAENIEYTVYLQRPGMIRIEYYIRDFVIVNAWDGETGWTLNPLVSALGPEPLTGTDLQALQEMAVMDDPLFHHRRQGDRIRLLGTSETTGASSYELEVVTKRGKKRVFLVDGESWQITRIKEKDQLGRQIEMVLSDYREMEGVMVPFTVVHYNENGSELLRISLKEVRFNQPVDPDLFDMEKN